MVRSTLLCFSSLGGPPVENPRFYEFMGTEVFKLKIEPHNHRDLKLWSARMANIKVRTQVQMLIFRGP